MSIIIYRSILIYLLDLVLLNYLLNLNYAIVRNINDKALKLVEKLETTLSKV